MERADLSQLAHDNAMKREIQAGAKPVTSLSTMLEWQRDWANRDTYDAVMDIVRTHCGAYGKVEEIDEDVERGRGCETLDRLDIGGDGAEDRATFVSAVVPEGEPLQVVIIRMRRS